MALKPCNECKQEVSTEATVCPHCGEPNPTYPRAQMKILYGALGLGAIIYVVWLIYA
jgi:hypothetical protein